MNAKDTVETLDVNCFICGSSEATLVAQTRDFCHATCANEFFYVSCDTCGHIYLKNRPMKSEISVIYPDSYATYNYEQAVGSIINNARNHVQRSKIRAVREYAQPGDTIIDVGCGGGDYLELIKRFGDPSWCPIGIDFSDQAIATLTARGIESKQGRFEELDWSGPQVGVIVMNQIIEHVENPSHSLEKAFQMLRPGGVLIMETPTLEGWDSHVFRDRYWGGWHAPRHWNMFTHETLTKIAKRSGFDMPKITYILSTFTVLHSIQYFIRGKIGRPKLAAWFDIDNIAALGLGVCFDIVAKIALQKTSNMQVICRKPLGERNPHASDHAGAAPVQIS